jgi:hypothetical protein
VGNYLRPCEDGSLDRAFTERFNPARFAEAVKGRAAARVELVKDVTVQLEPADSDSRTGSETSAPGSATTEREPETIWVRRLQLFERSAVIEFEGKPHRGYVLQARNAWDGAAWSNIVPITTDATGAGAFRDEFNVESSARFYRVIAEP